MRRQGTRSSRDEVRHDRLIDDRRVDITRAPIRRTYGGEVPSGVLEDPILGDLNNIGVLVEFGTQL